MELRLVCLLCAVAVAAAQVNYLGAPPDPSKPLGIHTLIGSKFLYTPRRFPLSPDRPYRDQARFIGQHGYHSEYLLEELSTGGAHHGGYHRR